MPIVCHFSVGGRHSQIKIMFNSTKVIKNTFMWNGYWEKYNSKKLYQNVLLFNRKSYTIYHNVSEQATNDCRDIACWAM